MNIRRVWLLGLLFFPLSSWAQSFQVYPISHGVVPRNAVNTPFLEIEVMGGSRTTVIEGITLRQTGLSTNDDVASLYVSGRYGRSHRASVGNDGRAYVRFRSGGYVIPRNGRDILTVLVNLEAEGSNRSVGFEVEEVRFGGGEYGEVGSRQYAVGGGDRYRSRAGGALVPSRVRPSNQVRTSSYSVPRLDFTPLGSGGSISIGRTSVLGKFRVSNPSRKTVYLDGLGLRNAGTARLTRMFDYLELQDAYGRQVALTDRIDRKKVFFELGDYVLGGGDSAVFRIMGVPLSGRSHQTIQFELERPEDLSAYIGQSYGYPTSARDNGARRSLSSYQADRGSIYITPQGGASAYGRPYTRNLWNRSLGPGADDATFLVQSLSFKAPVYVDRIRAVVASGSEVGDRDGDGYHNGPEDYEASFENFRLFINGEYIDQSDGFVREGGKIFVEFQVGEVLEGSEAFRVVGDITRAAQRHDRLKLRLRKEDSFVDWEYVR